MQIIETGLTFGPLQPREKTTLIVVHHSASPDVPAHMIHNWHCKRGWSGIGYHFIIRKDGSIERGRPQQTIGAHAGKNYNGNSIGICLCGNFMKEKPDIRQIASLRQLIIWLNQRYQSQNPAGLEIKLHREVAKTSCPGDLFSVQEIEPFYSRANQEGGQPVEEWKSKLLQEARQAGLITEEHDPDDPAPKWFVLAVALHLLQRSAIMSQQPVILSQQAVILSEAKDL